MRKFEYSESPSVIIVFIAHPSLHALGILLFPEIDFKAGFILEILKILILYFRYFYSHVEGCYNKLCPFKILYSPICPSFQTTCTYSLIFSLN